MSEVNAGRMVDPSGFVRAILNELVEKLRNLAATGRASSIDLRRLPLTAAERDELRRWLGQGEVRAEIDALGPSIITDTALPGVWWVIHKNSSGDMVGEMIEVALVPEIMTADGRELLASAETLAGALAAQGRR